MARPRPRRLKRTPGSRPPQPVIRVYCEGKTEKVYLEHLAQELRRSGVTVEIVGQQGVPRTIARIAAQSLKELKRAARRGEQLGSFEVWAVFDRDEHEGYQAAIEQCIANGVGLGWTNPCVELWALLHFQEQTAFIHRHDCQRQLRVHMPSYDHSRHPFFETEKMTPERLTDARQRAVLLHRRAEEAAPYGNPTVAVWKLVDVLLEGSAEKARQAAVEREDGSIDWWLDSDPGASPS